MIIRDKFLLILHENISCDLSSEPSCLNRLSETVQMRGHNIWFHKQIRKIILNYHQILSLI